MAPARSPLDRFVGAVHRRYVVQRLLERTGLGVLGGCAAAALLLPLLLWQDRPAVPAAAGALCLGGALGLLWGVTRRPTLLGAAMEADRQLGLADLLGTATALARGGRGTGDPWAGAVLASADARCRELRPRSVLLRGSAPALGRDRPVHRGSPGGGHAGRFGFRHAGGRGKDGGGGRCGGAAGGRRAAGGGGAPAAVAGRGAAGGSNGARGSGRRLDRRSVGRRQIAVGG